MAKVQLVNGLSAWNLECVYREPISHKGREFSDHFTNNFSLSLSEIEDVLKGMGLTKAPGPDMLPPIFFSIQLEMIQNFLISDAFKEGVNNTNWCLFPRKRSDKLQLILGLLLYVM